MRLRKLIRVGLAISLGLVVTFFLLEATLLIFDDWVFARSLWGFDPDLGFRVRPQAVYGAHTANRFGFNDRDYPLERAPGTYRALVVGDSFNWAGAQDWNYVGFLEDRLQEQFGSSVEVINVGYPATHTVEQLQILEKFGMQYQPDLVVLGFFAGNDFVDSEPWRRRIAYGGATIDLDTRRDRYWVVFGEPVMWRSRFRAALRQGLSAFWFQSRHEEMTEEQYLQLEYGRMLFTASSRREQFQPHIDWILDAVGQMDDLVVRAGGEFLVLAYPDEFQVNPELRRKVIEHYDLEEEDFVWTLPQDLLAEYCRSRNIEYQDLLPGFQRAAAQGEILYIPRNSHWNRTGNALAALLIEGMLQSRIRKALGAEHSGS